MPDGGGGVLTTLVSASRGHVPPAPAQPHLKEMLRQSLPDLIIGHVAFIVNK